jgi:DNA-binding SARP family transcriptional activator
VSARKIETLLAILLIRADQLVPITQLITEIWGKKPPPRATAALYVYISQLRKFLGRPGQSRTPITTKSPGYILRMDAATLDVHVFQQRVNQGRAHMRANRHEEALESFDSALGIWRGPALEDLRDSPTVHGFVAWAEEARLECVEMQIDATLMLGRDRELIGRLYALTAEHPLREAFHRQLMLALCRSGRQAEALRDYQSIRETLRGELGVEPCHALRDLHEAILAGDSQLQPFSAAS